MMGAVGEMYNVSRGQSKGHFYMLNMDTHGGIYTCTHTHTHTGPLARHPKLSDTPLKRGTLRPREKPPHTLRLNSRTRAKQSPDALGWAACVMPGHRVWTGVE